MLTPSDVVEGPLEASSDRLGVDRGGIFRIFRGEGGDGGGEEGGVLGGAHARVVERATRVGRHDAVVRAELSMERHQVVEQGVDRVLVLVVRAGGKLGGARGEVRERRHVRLVVARQRKQILSLLRHRQQVRERIGGGTRGVVPRPVARRRRRD